MAARSSSTPRTSARWRDASGHRADRLSLPRLLRQAVGSLQTPALGRPGALDAPVRCRNLRRGHGERRRVTVTLATGIPEDVTRRINLNYRDPATIDVEAWRCRSRCAGGPRTLVRISTGSAPAPRRPPGRRLDRGLPDCRPCVCRQVQGSRSTSPTTARCASGVTRPTGSGPAPRPGRLDGRGAGRGGRRPRTVEVGHRRRR